MVSPPLASIDKLPPIEQLLPSLQTAARAGDARAACQVAAAISRCVHLDRLISMGTDLKKSTDEKLQKARANDPSFLMPERAQRLLALLELESTFGRKHCEGFTEKPGDEAWRYGLMAAMNGHPRSMMRFGLGNTIVTVDGKSIISAEALDLYHTYALTLHERAAAAGERGAASTLADTYLIERYWNPNIKERMTSHVKKDIVKAAAYYRLEIFSADQYGVSARKLTELEKTMSAEQITQARELAQSLIDALPAGTQQRNKEIFRKEDALELRDECSELAPE